MKIAILGTSNSIMVNGYAPIYKAIEYPHQVDNLSLGGSYNNYGLLANELYKISEKYDIVILDFAVNDSGRFTIFSDEVGYADLFALFSILKKKCILINIIFCTNTEWNKINIRNINIEICKKLNIQYIDVYSCLQSIHNKKEPIFQDNAHISSFYSRLLAILIKQKRIEVTSIKYKIKNSIKDFFIRKELPKYQIFIKSAYDIQQENNELTISRYGSSFLVKDVIELQEKSIKLSINNAYLIGILAYLDKKSGYINITGSKSYKKLLTRHDTLMGSFSFKPIKEPIFIQNTLKLKIDNHSQANRCIPDIAEIDFGHNNRKIKIAYLLFSKEKIPTKKINIKQFEIESIQEYINLYKIINNILNNPKYTHIKSANILYVASYFVEDIKLKIKLLEQASKIKQNPYFYIALGDAYFQKKENNTSLNYYLKAYKKIKNENELTAKISNCYFRLKKQKKNKKLLEKELKRNPDYPPYYKLYAFLLLQENEIERAKNYMEKFINFAPYSQGNIFAAIDFYKRLNNRIKIINLLNDIKDVNNNLTQYINFIKKCHEFQQYELGFKAYNEAIKKFGKTKELEQAYLSK